MQNGVAVNASYPGIHAHIQKLIGQYGCAIHASFFDPQVYIFICQNIDGVVGFKKLSGIAVSMGPPLCAPIDIPQLIAAYQMFCDKNNMPRIYMAATGMFLDFARSEKYGLIETGKEQIVNVNTFVVSKNLASYCRNAYNAGVRLHELIAPENNDKSIVDQSWFASMQHQLTILANKAVGRRKGTQVYTCDVQPFAAPAVMRWFYATQTINNLDPQPVGLLVLLKIGHRQYAIDNCLQIDKVGDTPVNRNVTHALIVHMLKHIDTDFVSFHVTEIETLGEIIGFSRFQERMIRWGYRSFDKLLHSSGKHMFRDRYAKKATPSYIVFDPSKLDMAHAFALMQAVHVSRKKIVSLLLNRVRR